MTNHTDGGYTYLFEPAAREGLPTLLLLHGTGGDERDLLPVAKAVFPDAAILAVRGNVLEDGMRRFFRRISPGVFDLEDLEKRTDELSRFMEHAAEIHRFDPLRVVAIGFSNGANIAAGLLMRSPDALAGALLLRPMLPYDPQMPESLRGKPIYIGAGRQDGMVPLDQPERMAEIFEKAGAKVTLHWEDAGHGLTESDLAVAAVWMHAQFDT